MPQRAKVIDKASEPSAVTSQERMEMVPTSANLVGSMMIPAPIILAAVIKVNWSNDIFRRVDFIISPSFSISMYLVTSISILAFLEAK
ncbi:hypothetical protein HMPREF3182_01404 [Megasphaera hutchinsoni]|uniref:Uncharacterized protein n=1 Tax=Megasphaera hutchinsoni TaxID=1588748 RepID=A0A134CCZ6_9FIRM|nr:hypothetical protein HMPREF3182_01404 [Megasphaera hutchinsoni]